MNENIPNKHKKSYTFYTVLATVFNFPFWWFSNYVHDSPSHFSFSNLFFWFVLCPLIGFPFVWYFLQLLFFLFDLNPL